MVRQLVVSLVMVLCLGGAWAQTSSSHHVTVRIPSILRLKIGGETALSRAEVGVNIHVGREGYAITPTGTEVQVLANSAWQLNTRYAPSSARDAAAQLLWRLGEGEWQAFAAHNRLVTRGGPTGGWQSLTLTYGLAEPLPPTGNYSGIVTYTLTRP